VIVPPAIAATVFLRFMNRGDPPSWWAPLLLCTVIAVLAAYGAHALARDHLDMERLYSIPIAALAGGSILYWLTQ
jgi:hypothetical protein